MICRPAVGPSGCQVVQLSGCLAVRRRSQENLMRVSTRSVLSLALAGAVALPALASAQKITSPKEQFGFNIGDDYKLANYTQFEGYWRKLARESNRMKLVEIGKSAEGRPQLMAI